MMPGIYASCIATKGKTDLNCLLYTLVYTKGWFIFETYWGGKGYTILLSGQLLLIYIFECKYKKKNKEVPALTCWQSMIFIIQMKKY